MDTDPGSSTCHSVIGRRDSTTDDPETADRRDLRRPPQWSPDHKSFAFTRKTAERSAVWTANADGTGVRRIAVVAGGRVALVPGRQATGRPAPRGRCAAAVRRERLGRLRTATDHRLRGGGGPGVVPRRQAHRRLPAEDVGLADPCRRSVAAGRRTPPGDPPVPARARPRLVPGRPLLRLHRRSTRRGDRGDIHIVKADGTDDRTLVQTAAQEMDPVWSPGGKWVAFVRGPFDRPVIWAVRADGTGLRRLTTGSTPEGHPSWR
ncbi:hypothetical protein ACRAWF_19370 [Streptomyces sp. L7]